MIVWTMLEVYHARLAIKWRARRRHADQRARHHQFEAHRAWKRGGR